MYFGTPNFFAQAKYTYNVVFWDPVIIDMYAFDQLGHVH